MKRHQSNFCTTLRIQLRKQEIRAAERKLRDAVAVLNSLKFGNDIYYASFRVARL